MDETKEKVPEQCPDCGSTDKKERKHKCSHFWHKIEDVLKEAGSDAGNAIGQAKFGGN